MSVPENILQNRINFHSLYIADADAEIERLGYDDNNQIWHRARLFAKNITSRYTEFDHHISLYEYDLQELWYRIVQGAKIIDANHPAQDRLAGQVAHIKAMGILSRTIPSPQHGNDMAGGESAEMALTSKGRIWVDLPFLIDEIRKAWAKEMPARQRYNFSSFTARLASWGICAPDLCIYAIWILRDTLELSRPLASSSISSSDTQNDGVECKQEQEPSIASLLPAAIAWFEHCGYKIESLSIANQDYESSTIGVLAKASKVLPSSGFSMSRWLFWKSRLEEISHTDEREVADLASRGSRIMSFWGERIERIQRRQGGVEESIYV
ncbi:hypothetical protein EIK77_008163 [Talaromyces pinophilus]|nr:hypothetical protein EIK77_008163 [Talaromyces pinophilus]